MVWHHSHIRSGWEVCLKRICARWQTHDPSVLYFVDRVQRRRRIDSSAAPTRGSTASKSIRSLVNLFPRRRTMLIDNQFQCRCDGRSWRQPFSKIDLAQHGLKAGRARTQLESLPTRHQTQNRSASITSVVEKLSKNCPTCPWRGRQPCLRQHGAHTFDFPFTKTRPPRCVHQGAFTKARLPRRVHQDAFTKARLPRRVLDKNSSGSRHTPTAHSAETSHVTAETEGPTPTQRSLQETC